MICPWNQKECVHIIPICGADGREPCKALFCTIDPKTPERFKKAMETDGDSDA